MPKAIESGQSSPEQGVMALVVEGLIAADYDIRAVREHMNLDSTAAQLANQIHVDVSRVSGNPVSSSTE